MKLPEDVEVCLNNVGGEGALLEMLPSEGELKSLSQTYKALGDPKRLLILYALSHMPLCVCMLKKITGMADSKLSYHLSILKDAGLVSCEKDKNWHIYRITEMGRKYTGIYEGRCE